MDHRLTRRLAGLLLARLPALHLERVPDPRRPHRQRWPLATLLRAVLVGLAAGLRSLAEVEHLTAELARPLRRHLGLGRRVADTTLRDALVQVDPATLRPLLHAQVHEAQRRKALVPHGLPFGVVALDGKATAATAWDDTYAQRQPHSAALGACGLVRTVTCTLVSSRVKVCLDALSIPPATNEMGFFPTALDQLCTAYPGHGLFGLVSYDAGACSLANATAVAARDLYYLFGLKATQPTLLHEAQRLLGHLPVTQAAATTEDVTGTGSERRYLFVTAEMAGYEWPHLATVVRVRSERYDAAGRLVATADRYYLSSVPTARLTAAQWLLLIRRHWGVENECHGTWDKLFAEDRHPWISAAPQGMLVVMLLRRLAYNLLALWRGVTQRGDEQRQTPWRDVMRWIYNTLIAAREDHLAGLRPRLVPDPSA